MTLLYTAFRQARFDGNTHWATVYRPFLIDFHDAGLWIFCLIVSALFAVMCTLWWYWDAAANNRTPSAPGPAHSLPDPATARVRTALMQGCRWMHHWVEGTCVCVCVCADVHSQVHG